MTFMFLLLGAVFGALACLQFAMVISYLSYVARFKTPEFADQDLPPAAIVMALRGTDPFIEQCLNQLARQNYPRYRIRLIVDNPGDTALPAVEKWCEEYPDLDVSVDFLHDPGPDCTLYCSSLHQAICSLEPDVEVVAFANADTMPHKNWLRSLVSPLLIEGVGAVTGNRWYLPQRGKWGSLVRYVQNASAIIAMRLLGLLWGGSLALKRSVFANPIFLNRLRNACCEDHAIHETLQASGQKVVFTPAVLMVNREECTLPSGFRFMRRQLAWTRIYHPGWNRLVIHAGFTALLIAATFATSVAGLLQRDWFGLAWLAVGVGTFFAAHVITLWLTHFVIMRRVRAEQGDVGRFSWLLLPKLLVAIPFTLYVHLATVVSAAMMREVEWRGIRYEVVSPRRIKLVAYRPYQPVQTVLRENMSL